MTEWIKCDECKGFLPNEDTEGSCCCDLSCAFAKILNDLGIEEYWIKDIHYDYEPSDFIDVQTIKLETVDGIIVGEKIL